MNNKAAEINQKSTNYRKGFYGREAEFSLKQKVKSRHSNFKGNQRKPFKFEIFILKKKKDHFCFRIPGPGFVYTQEKCQAPYIIPNRAGGFKVVVIIN